MRTALLLLSLSATLAIAGCGRLGSGPASGLNPLGWLGGGNAAPTTLAPRGGWPDASSDPRSEVPQILSASLQPLNDGRLLVVEAFAPEKGWWELEIINETPQPAGRLRPDPDGVLRLVAVGYPPPRGEGRPVLVANPQIDRLRLALPISTVRLERIRRIEIRSATNGIVITP